MMILPVVILVSCRSVGPPSIKRDRFDYVMAISESWKRQILVNLLKTRYSDVPVFMDVASVINSYTLEGQLELELGWQQSSSQNILGTGTYTDKPTITYHPLAGRRFAQSLLTPIPVASVLTFLQNGLPADDILRICTLTINGRSNDVASTRRGREADVEFREIAILFRRLQDLNALAFRAKILPEATEIRLIVRQEGGSAEVNDVSRRLLELLNLDPALGEYPIVFGRYPTKPNEISIQTRSMMQVMAEYASYVDVPESDVAEGRVGAPREGFVSDNWHPIIRVRNGESRPEDAYVAVNYRDHWFWVADTDLDSKGSLAFLMVLFASTEKEGDGQATPIITIPASD